jgi:hypothetical protein
MRRLEILVAAAMVSAAIGTLAVHSARAQTFPVQPKISVETRIAALEQKVATLEAQNAELRGVIQISSSSVTIKSSGQIALKGGSLEVESTGKTVIKASGDVIVKGSRINLN